MLSNGHMLVGLDELGMVHDFYYPYVGLDNLTTSRSVHHKIGVWVEDKFSWLDDGTWKIIANFEDQALISSISAYSEAFGIELSFKDFIDYEYTAFCRYITVINKSDKEKEIRIFLHQVFQISRAGRGDTALYVPSGSYILDYKGWCSLLIYAQNETGQPFDQFAVGNYGIEGKEGTFRDAEDGSLSNNLVEHGGVDSVVRLCVHLAPQTNTTMSYWIVAGNDQFDAEIVHRVLLQQGLPKRIDLTRNYWRDWLEIGQEKISKIEPKYQVLVKKSLMIIKAHADRHGGIIASCDSSIYNYDRDYYSYVWPRDAAWALIPLITLGYKDVPRKFFEFCADTMHPGGYMAHKYQPDHSVGSTWHPLMHKHHPELAIQEDETAIVIYALGWYLKCSSDADFVSKLYEEFIKPAAEFMSGFMDQATHLPHPSYDLWEQKFGTHTYSVSVTVAALQSSVEMAQRLQHFEDAKKWQVAAELIAANLHLLFSSELQHYRKSLLLQEDGNLEYDNVLDASSAYGVMRFASQGLLAEDLSQSFKKVEQRLLSSCPIGGIPRYEHDDYFLKQKQYLGNPWIVTTLWQAQYYIKQGQRDKAQELIDWTVDRASQSGMLSEQVDPENGYSVGVSPLVWSHATFIDTVLMLADTTSVA